MVYLSVAAAILFCKNRFFRRLPVFPRVCRGICFAKTSFFRRARTSTWTAGICFAISCFWFTFMVSYMCSSRLILPDIRCCRRRVLVEYWGGMGIVGVCWEAGWFVGAVAGGWQAVAGDKPPRYIDRGSDSRFLD